MAASPCPICHKLCRLVTTPPVIENLLLEDTREDTAGLSIELDTKIRRNSTCCDAPVKEHVFCTGGEVVIEGHIEEEHTIFYSLKELHSVEDLGQKGGRTYGKSYFVIKLTIALECTCGEPVSISKLVVDDCSEYGFIDNLFWATFKVAPSEMTIL